jgi:hypothetical protein
MAYRQAVQAALGNEAGMGGEKRYFAGRKRLPFISVSRRMILPIGVWLEILIASVTGLGYTLIRLPELTETSLTME